MKKLLQSILPVFLLFYACNINTEKVSIEKWKHEILETEQDFAKMAISLFHILIRPVIKLKIKVFFILFGRDNLMGPGDLCGIKS